MFNTGDNYDDNLPYGVDLEQLGIEDRYQGYEGNDEIDKWEIERDIDI